MTEENKNYLRAKKKVEAKRSFYIHLIVYVLVNILLFVINTLTSPDTLWFFWPLMGWGIGIFIHAYKTFIVSSPFGEEWEEKKIKEEMEKA